MEAVLVGFGQPGPWALSLKWKGRL